MNCHRTSCPVGIAPFLACLSYTSTSHGLENTGPPTATALLMYSDYCLVRYKRGHQLPCKKDMLHVGKSSQFDSCHWKVDLLAVVMNG